MAEGDTSPATDERARLAQEIIETYRQYSEHLHVTGGDTSEIASREETQQFVIATMDRYAGGNLTAADISHIIGTLQAVMRGAILIGERAQAALADTDAARVTTLRNKDDVERLRNEVLAMRNEATLHKNETARLVESSEQHHTHAHQEATSAREARDMAVVQCDRSERLLADVHEVQRKANETLVAVLNEKRKIEIDRDRIAAFLQIAVAIATILGMAFVYSFLMR